MIPDVKDFFSRHMTWIVIFSVALLLIAFFFPEFLPFLAKSVLMAIVYETVALCFIGIGLYVVSRTKWTAIDPPTPAASQSAKNFSDIGKCLVIGSMILGVHILFGLIFYMAQWSPK
jgi:magnesium-transporting ATPase (P-type)